MKKLGLALGGGGAKGMAHLGILRVLEKEKIPVSAIAGTSIGALIGGLYALEQDVEYWIDKFLDYFLSIGFKQLYEKLSEKSPGELEKIIEESIVNIPPLIKSFFTRKRSEGLFGDLVPKINIEDLKIPFAAISCDILSGKEIIFTKGSLRTAIHGSFTVPGIWQALEYDEMYLMDGGTIDNVPVNVARKLGAKKIIAVDVRPDLQTTKTPKTRFDMFKRVLDIQQYYLAQNQIDSADVSIRPELGPIPWADFRTAKACIALGEKAARIHLKEIIKMLK